MKIWGVCLLMTDGTVICHDTNGPGEGTGWNKLTPNINGSYINGTWSSIGSMNYDRLFFASQVLPDGRVFAAGGEYGAGATRGEVYDPVTDVWTNTGTVTGNQNIYDGNSQLLDNGTVLVGLQNGAHPSFDNLFYTPGTNAWTTAPICVSPYNHDEAEWLKLPDSSILFVGRSSTASCRYMQKTNTWIVDGTLPVNLWDALEESGAAFMLPNGKSPVFFGALGHNAIYTPSGNSTPGTWTVAADFPKIGGVQMCQSDASAAMMVNGHILCAVSPIYTTQSFPPPTFFVEYDYTTNTFTQVKKTIPGAGGDSIGDIASYQTQMLALPDGNLLVSISQDYSFSNHYFIYTPGSAAIPQGKPTVNSILTDGCPNYKITGKLFNGISEGAAYGDDWQMSTNYPVIRLTNGSNVYYGKTALWNRIGAVQTDSLEDTVVFTPPSTLPAGTYSLVVVVNGFASNPILFKTLGITIASHNNVSCNGGTGSATANAATGGISPYTYSWSPSGGTNLTASSLSAGTYTIKVTDNNGCTSTASLTITQPNVLAITIASHNNVLCHGGTGSITANTPTGGTSPYTYTWTPSGGTNITASGISAGTYTITVKDNHGCSATASATITQPTQLNITANTTANVTCGGGNNGSVSSTASGGTSPYTYAWSGGGTNSTKTGLSAGTYTITVTDKNGCTATASTIITQPTLLSVTASTTKNVSCNGAANGIVSSTPSGGVSPYTYSWTGGSTNSTESGLSIGTYTIIVTDINGCMASALTTITQPNTLTTIANVVANVSCFGESNGSISSIPSGGTSPYTYAWTGGKTNVTITGLTLAKYTIKLTYITGCSGPSYATIPQPTALLHTDGSISAIIGNCDGSAWVIENGGTSPYTYSWSPGGATTDTISGQCPKNYCCTIIDHNGCIDSTCITIVTGIPEINNPSLINVYPDPNTGSFTISGLIHGQVINIYNYTGQKISTTVADNETIHFNISTCANGIYLIRSHSKDGSNVTQKKIVKTQ